MTELETKLSQILEEKQNKIIPENIKKGIQIFDIEGTYEGNSGDVKLFETEEQMQQDPNANEGDLAIVYKNEVNNVTADSRFQYVTFPETVTLPAAVTTDSFCMLRAVDTSTMFDGQIMLNASLFRFDGYSETEMIRVQYSSTDGINYTRDDTVTNPVDLGTEVLIYNVNSFTTDMGYFMQIDRSTFEGLYENKIADDIDIINAVTNITYNGTVNYDISSVLSSNIDKVVSLSTSYFKNTLNADTISGYLINCKSSIEYELYCTIYTPSASYGVDGINRFYTSFDIDGNSACKIMPFRASKTSPISSSQYKFLKLNINISTNQITEEDIPISSLTVISDSTDTNNLYIYEVDVSNNIFVSIVKADAYDLNDVAYTLGTIEIENYENAGFNIGDIDIVYPKVLKYYLAPTQFTLAASNELLPGKIAYGKNGIITGDDTVYDNLDTKMIINKIYQIDDSTLSTLQSNIYLPSDVDLETLGMNSNKVYGLNLDESTDDVTQGVLIIDRKEHSYTHSITDINSTYLNSAYNVIYNNYVYSFIFTMDKLNVLKFSKNNNILDCISQISYSATSILYDRAGYQLIGNTLYIIGCPSGGGSSVELYGYTYNLDTEQFSTIISGETIESTTQYGITLERLDIENTTVVFSYFGKDESGNYKQTTYNWSTKSKSTVSREYLLYFPNILDSHTYNKDYVIASKDGNLYLCKYPSFEQCLDITEYNIPMYSGYYIYSNNYLYILSSRVLVVINLNDYTVNSYNTLYNSSINSSRYSIHQVNGIIDNEDYIMFQTNYNNTSRFYVIDKKYNDAYSVGNLAGSNRYLNILFEDSDACYLCSSLYEDGSSSVSINTKFNHIYITDNIINSQLCVFPIMITNRNNKIYLYAVPIQVDNLFNTRVLTEEEYNTALNTAKEIEENE